jgi:molecular chaperone GrpE (heat shock protein)
MNILQISKKVINNKTTAPLLNIFKKNIVSFSIKNSMKFQNNFNMSLRNQYISKTFFSNSREKEEEKKEQTEEKTEKSEKETVEEKENKKKVDPSENALNEKYKELKTLYNEQELKLEQTRKKFHEIKELYLKNVDEIDAIKLRSDREIKNSKDYAITKFAKDLLDVHDNFGRALGVISDKDFKSLTEEEKVETFDSFVEGKLIIIK